jgi:mycothiol synthase
MGRAVGAGDMLASSDPHGLFVLKVFAADPTQFGGAFDGGDLVGFVSPNFKIAVVRPDRRHQGIGRALVDLGLSMSGAKGEPELIIGVLPGDGARHAFLQATGFGYHSTVWDLDLPVDAVVPRPAWPEGFVGRAFDRTRDLDAWIRVFNAAFADHPTPLQVDPKLVQATLDDPDNEDTDIVVVEATATGDIVGFCNCDMYRRDGKLGDHAELWSIGVRPDLQGRGLGRQLVRAGVENVRALGIPNASLSVNGRNESALRLYESEGFIRVRTRDRWSRPVVHGSERAF